MLVTFRCDAHENITMIGDHAVKLIKMMGHSGTIPSAILAEDVPQALSLLKKSIASEAENQMPTDEDDDQAVSIANRAWPLIELLEDAIKADSNVMWQKA